MGCDIHMHLEYKKNGRWWCGDYYRVNPYYYEKGNNEPKYTKVSWCEDRNYGLFATLANVRNYSDNDYIDEPRGLPDDITKEVEEDSDDWGIDGHSHSYFTLRELIEYRDTHPFLKRSGLVSKEEYDNYKNFGTEPTEWCQGSSDRTLEYLEWEVENKALYNLIEKIKERANDLFLIYDFMWGRNKEERMKNAEDIRIVFWFDN